MRDLDVAMLDDRPASENVSSPAPQSERGAEALWSCVAELETLAGSSKPHADLLADLLARLRRQSPTTKARARAVAATLRVLERLDPENIGVAHLSSLLQGILPAYLSDGTRATMLPFLRKALPWITPAALDAKVAAGLLGGLGGLPLDEPTKAVVGDALVTLAPRLRELLRGMEPEQLAGSAQALRLVRGGDRPVMLELLGELLGRALVVAAGTDGSARWTPQALAGLCHGLLGVRSLDAAGIELARDVVSAALPLVAPRLRELSPEETSDLFTMLASFRPLDDVVAGPFLDAVLPHLQTRAGALRPSEIATIVRGLGHLRLDAARRRQAAAFAQKALLTHPPKDFSAFEAARILVGLGRLSHDATELAVTAAFAVAASATLGGAGERLPLRDLAEVAILLGTLPVDHEGRKRLRQLLDELATSITGREAKLTDRERMKLLATFEALGATGNLDAELVERWRRVKPEPPEDAAPAAGDADTGNRLPSGSAARLGSANAGAGTPLPHVIDAPLSGRQAAAEIGVSVTELYRRLRKRGIDTPGTAGFTPSMVEQLRSPSTAAHPVEGSVEAAPARSSPAPATRISLREAAKQIGVDRGALTRWVREDQELSGAVERRGRRVLFSHAAMEIAHQVHAQRMAEAPEGLRRAWAAKRKGAVRAAAAPVERPEAIPALPTLPAAGDPSATGSRDAALLEAMALATRMLESVEQIASAFRETVRQLLEQQSTILELTRTPANRPMTLEIDVDPDS